MFQNFNVKVLERILCDWAGQLGSCVFFFKQKTAYEIRLSLVGSEMCIRDSLKESEEKD